MRTKERFLSELRRFHEEAYEKGKKLDAESFFAKPEKGWSIAENFLHAAKVNRIMALIFAPAGAPMALLLGSAGDERPTLQEFMNRYHAGLKKGFPAGPFAPGKEHPPVDSQRMEDRQREILEEWKKSGDGIERNVGRLSDEQLRKKQFLHPTLGRIPFIDAAYMAIFHAMHHLKNASRKSGADLCPDMRLV